MSLRAIVDVVLHLESFRNIDLFQQGLYHLRFEVFHSTPSQKRSASPYNQYVQEPAGKASLTLPGGIEDIYYKTRSFYIKYCDEEVEINEIAVFRTEVELDSETIPPLTVLCSLMYCDVGGRVSERVMNTLLASPPEFRAEALAEVEISSFIQGANLFVPIIFDDQHFCVMNSTVHVVVIDFRFRPRPAPLPAADSAQPAQPARPARPAQELNMASSLSEIFFPTQAALTPELVASVYSKYIRLLSAGQTKNSILVNHWRKFVGLQAAPSPQDSLGLAAALEDPSGLADPGEGFCARLDSLDPAGVSEKIMAEIQVIAGNMNCLLFELTDTLLKASKAITLSMMYTYNALLKSHWGKSVVKKVYQVESYTLLAEQNLNSVHKAEAKALRASVGYQNMEKLPIFLRSYFPSPDLHPILFLDVYTKLVEDKEDWKADSVKFSYIKSKPRHLVVLVHGFQGNSFDVRLIRNQVALCRPDTLLMCSHMNEGETEGDISEMGERLSEEVLQYIHEWCPQNSLEKVSFIGHSLGGLIIRASLPHLKSLSSKFQFLLTFSSPHLGYMYNTSKLVDAGMWIIKKLKKSLSLKQLSMTDTNEARSSFLYKLSNLQGLEWFRNVALVGAHQDNYAPFESARVEVGAKAAGDARGRLYIEMASNLLGRIRAERIGRIDVSLKLRARASTA